MAGLLDFLMQMQQGGLLGNLHQPDAPPGYQMMPQQSMQQQPMQFGGDNQPSPLDNAQWPQGPMGAPLPPNATPTQGQAPTQLAQQAQAPQPQPQPDRMTAGFANMSSGGNPFSMIANSIRGFQTGERTDPQGMAQAQQQMIVRALESRGTNRADALLAASNPDMMKALLPRLWPTYAAHNVGNTSGAFNPATGDFKPHYTAPKFEKVGPGESLYSVGGSGQQATQVASGGPEKPPAGYAWNDTKSADKGMSPIAGGPATHLPVETAGRLAMIDAALPGLTKAKEILLRDRGALGDGVSASVGYTLNAGDAGRAKRAVRIAIESALRTATGAAAPEQEVNRYLDMYMPMPSDGPETARQKFDSLETFMRAARQNATAGRKPTSAGGSDPLGLR